MPSGWSGTKIEKIKMYCTNNPVQIRYYKWSGVKTDDIWWPDERDYIGEKSLSGTGWQEFSTNSTVP